MNFLDKSEDLSRTITDVEATVTIGVKFGVVTIDALTPRIFLSNFEFPFKNPGHAVYGRRVFSFKIASDPAVVGMFGAGYD